VQSRLDIAKECGATHTINTTSFTDLKSDLEKAIKEIVPSGTNFIIDTTGVLPIIEAGVASIKTGGQLLLVGVMSGLKLEIDLSDMLANGKTVRGVIEGTAKPSKVRLSISPKEEHELTYALVHPTTNTVVPRREVAY
jgi:Zn-dependent alcohol dehydrogenase